MISGAHVIVYSKDADADRAFFRDVLGFPSIDAGSGWLIFALPPSEVAVHPADVNAGHELYLMCDDIDALVRTLRDRDVPCSPVRDVRWGLLVEVTLPGGGRLGIYEPKHPRPRAPRARPGRAAGRQRAGTSRNRKRAPRSR